jgi:hypothetical protein
VDLLTGPAFYRRFIAHRPFPLGYAAVVVDHVLAAFRCARKGQSIDPTSPA